MNTSSVSQHLTHNCIKTNLLKYDAYRRSILLLQCIKNLMYEILLLLAVLVRYTTCMKFTLGWMNDA